ncbi:uncharacterized protein Triagg1_356 [Trichoderma aggressivum f. europaeum]|uniref:Uncharacterized protein n=1 Tax=Trichoderma aggressivum f. europaeum TaxID=173218 RepID=A0AAE1IL92_9HYPO|nr:hypothetical protein Triagg1_356 [Trichoderma aggressivum f. europaeum]
MAASPPLVTSDILDPEASPSPRINETQTREGIASVISTIRAQIADQPAGAMGPVSQPPAMANAVTGSTPPVPVLGAPAVSSSSQTSATTNASNGVATTIITERGYPGAVPNRSHQALVSPPLSGPAAAGQPGQKQFGSIAPKTAPSEEKTKAYERLMDLVQNTDASVVRQVVRENWHKCLVGSDYHCGFVANAAVNYSSSTVLSRTMQDNGDKVLKSSKREIAKHFRGEDLDEIADLIGPKLGTQFQDRVMATRLETIAAQDLINALARAERLGYHINDVVKKKPGQGGENVIPSITALLTSLPPMPPHQVHGGVPPPPMPPHIGPGPPQQLQQPPRAPQGQHPIPIMRSGNITFRPPSTPSHPPTPTIPIGNIASQPHPNPAQTAGIMYCATCHRPCSSTDALNYHSKKAKCHTSRPYGTIDVDECVHCGCQFESPGGLAYHTKSYVCGQHNEETRLHILELLRQRELLQKMTPHQPSNNRGPPSFYMAPSQPAPAVIKSNITPNRRPVGSAQSANPSPSTNDPYAKLTPEQRTRFDTEMKEVEEHYGRLRRDAEALPPGEREDELAKIKNRYNTKQSNTRKKYGIRLRERRTNADMERSWNADHAHPSKKARLSDGQARPAGNQVVESPRRRVPLAEMGGLSASSATAELVDPTVSSTNPRPPPAYGQPAAPVQGVPPGAYQGTPDDPMQIDDDTSTGTDSDNVDIPARI